ncbi:MAG TPA: hypothetical protein VM910_12255 [Bradyrhizobium sp.]|nr:hypothetical protein [Bradyrhizobium sp.]
MIAYWAVPYLLVAAPPVILLLTILMGGCTMTRTASDPMDSGARFYSDPNSQASGELIKELDRRAAREDLRRAVEEIQR